MLIRQESNIISFKEAKQIMPDEFSILDENLEIELIIQKNRLALSCEDLSPFQIDLNKKWQYHRSFFQKNSIFKDPLCKALGFKNSSQLEPVTDLTCGAMNDTLLMASYGVKVYAYERHPVIAALIINALKNSQEKIKEMVDFQYGEVKEFRTKIAYFDPMYSEKNKKTAPKKEMQIFRKLLSADDDAKAFALSVAKKVKRLVVKRSNKAGYLLENPSHSIHGKSTRYDVYLKH
jgi:16S rRNA (guanine1516-N2)-methyltransferase